MQRDFVLLLLRLLLLPSGPRGPRDCSPRALEPPIKLLPEQSETKKGCNLYFRVVNILTWKVQILRSAVTSLSMKHNRFRRFLLENSDCYFAFLNLLAVTLLSMKHNRFRR